MLFPVSVARWWGRGALRRVGEGRRKEAGIWGRDRAIGEGGFVAFSHCLDSMGLWEVVMVMMMLVWGRVAMRKGDLALGVRGKRVECSLKQNRRWKKKKLVRDR